MKTRYPTLFSRAKVRPRVHRVFAGMGFALAVGLLLALMAAGDGDPGQRFNRAFGKGILLIAFSCVYFGWALTLRATRDPVWAALSAGQIRRVYYPYEHANPSGTIIEPRVGVETVDGKKLVVECQTAEQQQAILEEFRAGGSVEVTE